MDYEHIPRIMDKKILLSNRRYMCAHLCYTIPKSSDVNVPVALEPEEDDDAKDFGIVIQKYTKNNPDTEKLTQVRGYSQTGNDSQNSIYLTLKEFRELLRAAPYIEDQKENVRDAKIKDQVNEWAKQQQGNNKNPKEATGVVAEWMKNK